MQRELHQFFFLCSIGYNFLLIEKSSFRLFPYFKGLLKAKFFSRLIPASQKLVSQFEGLALVVKLASRCCINRELNH